MTFGQGALSYSWTPVDADLRTNPSIDRSLTRDIFTYSTTIPVGPIPVSVSAGASLRIGFHAQVGLYHQDAPVVDSGLRGTMGITGGLEGFAEAGVGVSYMGVRVGAFVHADLTLAEVGLQGTLLVTLRRIDAALDFTFRSALRVTIEAGVHVPLPWPLPDIDISHDVELVDIAIAQVRIRLFRIVL